MTSEKPTPELKAEVIAIHSWIRDDLPLSMKMIITPVHIDALIAKLSAVQGEEEGGPAGGRLPPLADARTEEQRIAGGET